MNKYLDNKTGFVIVDSRQSRADDEIVDDRSHIDIFDDMFCDDDIDVDLICTSNSVRAERDARLSQIAWRYERNARETRLGIEETDSLSALDAYAQALADVPQQMGFPATIEWPVFEGYRE